MNRLLKSISCEFVPPSDDFLHDFINVRILKNMDSFVADSQILNQLTLLEF